MAAKKPAFRPPFAHLRGEFSGTHEKIVRMWHRDAAPVNLAECGHMDEKVQVTEKDIQQAMMIKKDTQDQADEKMAIHNLRLMKNHHRNPYGNFYW